MDSNISDYHVENFQIPVPLGDCSLHICMRGKAPEKVIIIDGGKHSKTAGEPMPETVIAVALEKIAAKLGSVEDVPKTTPTTNTSLKITGTKTALPKITPPNAGTTKIMTEGAPQSSGKGAAPLTFTVNSWVVTHWDEDHCLGMIEFLLSDDSQIKAAREKFFKRDALSLQCGAHWKDASNGVRDGLTKLGKEGWFTKKMNIKIGKELLGFDLFTGEQILNSWVPPLDHPKSKDVKIWFPSAKHKPRFVVVGADGYTLANEPSAVSNFEYNVDKKINTRHASNPTKNETSILALLIWPNAEAQAGSRVSYFTGGDGFPEAEVQVFKRLLERGAIAKTCAVLKLDHHGSSRDNISKTKGRAKKGIANHPSLRTVDELKPRKVIVTPGDQYGHPCWDVICLIVDYFRRQNIKEKAFYTTRTPYWMAKAVVNFMDVNAKHYDNLQKVYEQQNLDMYQDRITKGCLGFGSPVKHSRSTDFPEYSARVNPNKALKGKETGIGDSSTTENRGEIEPPATKCSVEESKEDNLEGKLKGSKPTEKKKLMKIKPSGEDQKAKKSSVEEIKDGVRKTAVKGNTDWEEPEYIDDDEDNDSDYDEFYAVGVLSLAVDDYKEAVAILTKQKLILSEKFGLPGILDAIRKGPGDKEAKDAETKAARDKVGSKVKIQLQKDFAKNFRAIAIEEEYARTRGAPHGKMTRSVAKAQNIKIDDTGLPDGPGDDEREVTDLHQAQLIQREFTENTLLLLTRLWKQICSQATPAVGSTSTFLLHFTSVDDDQQDGTFDSEEFDVYPNTAFVEEKDEEEGVLVPSKL